MNEHPLARQAPRVEVAPCILEGLRLDRHITPPMHGLGSSFFCGRMLPPGCRTRRCLEMVETRDTLSPFLKKAVSEYPTSSARMNERRP